MYGTLVNATQCQTIDKDDPGWIITLLELQHWANGKGISCLVDDISKVKKNSKCSLRMPRTVLHYLMDCKVLPNEEKVL